MLSLKMRAARGKKHREKRNEWRRKKKEMNIE